MRLPTWYSFDFDPEDERRSEALLRLDLDIATRLLTDNLTCVEAETRAYTVHSTVVGRKKLLLVFAVDTDSLVSHRHFNCRLFDLFVDHLTLNCNLLVTMAVFYCILEQAEEDLCETSPVVLEKVQLCLFIDIS